MERCRILYTQTLQIAMKEEPSGGEGGKLSEEKVVTYFILCAATGIKFISALKQGSHLNNLAQAFSAFNGAH